MVGKKQRKLYILHLETICLSVSKRRSRKSSSSWFFPPTVSRSWLYELPLVAVEQRGLRPFSSSLSSAVLPRQSGLAVGWRVPGNEEESRVKRAFVSWKEWSEDGNVRKSLLSSYPTRTAQCEVHSFAAFEERAGLHAQFELGTAMLVEMNTLRTIKALFNGISIG